MHERLETARQGQSQRRGQQATITQAFLMHCWEGGVSYQLSPGHTFTREVTFLPHRSTKTPKAQAAGP